MIVALLKELTVAVGVFERNAVAHGERHQQLIEQ